TNPFQTGAALGRFDSLRSPLRGRPAVDPSPLRSVASESPRGRICTCVGPLRRRRPELLGHAEKNGPRGGTPTHNTAFEAPHDCNFTTRGKNWSLHEDLHLDLELRGLASCLLDDEGEKWSPPPESHRPGPVYKTGTSLATSDGHGSPRR